MAKELPADLIKETCPSCPLFATKPTDEPAHMAFALNEVARLENKKAIGVQLGELSSFQEAVLVGALQGRNRSDANRIKDSGSNDSPGKIEIPQGMGRLD